MNRRLRILLVQPAWDGLAYRRKIKVDERAIHPLSLGVVAALSGDHEVRLVNEAQQALPPSAGGFDVVGISVNTFNAPRAGRIADRYRAEHVPVVLGGPHTALLPEECLRHADAIVIGDAEDTWPQVLEDIQGRKLQPRYVSTLQDGSLTPAPRRELFHHNSRHVAFCQMSRGCSNQCRFCYLQYLPHRALRLRDVNSIVLELRSLPQQVILFVDDNVFCQPEYAREVFRAIAPLEKKWWIQAPTNLHRLEGLIEVMARGGCFSVSLGFQTASQANTEAEHILQNRVEEYGELVRRLHRAGILVDGTFIFGFDGDDPGTFERTAELIASINLDTYTFYFLTPYPGTEYFAQFQREGRLLHEDWSRYDWDHVVVRPRHMTVAEVRAGVANLYRRLDRGYFCRHLVWQIPVHLRNLATPKLSGFLAATGWHYFRSPVQRENEAPSVPCRS